jgi:tetratricopeptide (TPR) repeat protein
MWRGNCLGRGLVEEKIGALAMRRVQKRTTLRHQAQGGTFLPSDEFAKWLPGGWPTDIPLVRIWTCGMLAIEVLREVRHDPDGRLVLVYEAPDECLMQRKGSTTALNLLKLLASQPGRLATKDWLLEKLHRSRGDKEEWGGLTRFDNVVSLLRGLLCPQGMPGEDHLRKILVEWISSTPESGTGYRLACFPLIWLDVEAIGAHVQQAQEREAGGQDAFPSWHAAYEIGKRGPFLADAQYSDWATGKRGEIEGYLWQSVQALWRLYLARQEATGEEEALRLLQDYWLKHSDNEQAFLPLLNLLSKYEEYQLAERYYEMLCEVLGQTERQPTPRIEEAMLFLRTQQHQEVRGPYRIEVRSHKSDESPLQAVEPRSMYDGHALTLLPGPVALPGSSLPRFWNVPYQRNPLFTGREDILMRLHEMLTRKQTVVAVAQQALCGLGGIGKTQTVLEYIYRYGSEYQAVFWVKADTRENLFADFLSLAQLLTLPERDSQDRTIAAAAIGRWLQEHVGWLLVFDNADDLEMVREVLPTGCQGHVLLTTRAQAMGRVAHRLEVEEMSLEIGALFLLRRAGMLDVDAPLEKASEKDRISAERLVQELGGLPLALDQAGAYIEEASLNIEEYRELYRQQKYTLLKRRGGLITDHPEPVATTWILSFTCVEQMNRGAADLLRFCAFLNPDAIPEEVFTKGSALVCSSLALLGSDAVGLHQAVEALRKYSLVRRNPETKILAIHRLVQASIQGAMDQETQGYWATLTIQSVSAAFPNEVTVACWPLCQRLLPHVQMCVALADTYRLVLPEAAQLFNQAGYYLRERALYLEAESLYKKAFAIREQALGTSHPDTAQVLYNLARLYYDLGQYTLCETLHLQALEIREQTVPVDHLALALSLNSLAFLYYIQTRKLDEAERLYQRALPLFDVAIGMDHPKTAHCLSNLALLYVSQGKDTEAEQLLLHVQAIRETSLGPMHLDTARSLQNLAWFYIYLGKQERYAEAKQLLERSLAIRETLLGPEHPQGAMSLNHLALLCEAQGDYAGAKPLYQQVLTIRRKMMGRDNPKVLLTEAGYAALLRKMGLDEEAAPLEAHVQAMRSNT